MALTVDEANAVSHEYFDKTMKQQVYDETVFLARLKKDNKMRAEGGTLIQFPIRYAKLENAEASGARSQFVFSSKETRTAGRLDFAYYKNTTIMHWDERRENAGKSKIISLIKDKHDELREDFMDKMATDIFASSQATNAIAPLAVIVDSADTYAGVAVSDASEWAANEDGSTTTLTLYGDNSLSYMINQSTFGKNMPTLHITTRELATKAESLIEPQKRYTDKETADMGFHNVTFHGKPIVGDPYVSTGDWFGLDMTQFELACDPGDDFYVSDWFEMEQAGFPRSLGKYMTFRGNIICRTRKTNFKFTALDYTL